MSNYKLNIYNSDYSKFSLIGIDDNNEIIIENKPNLIHGLFNNDIVKLDIDTDSEYKINLINGIN